jgi:trk system potassium uptake protein TrkA
MRILLIGAGEVGQYLAGTLIAEHHQVTLIDSNPEKIQAVNEVLDLSAVVGSGSCFDILEKADAANAELVLAMTDSEHVNMLACYHSKIMGAKYAIARVQSEDVMHGHAQHYRYHLGIDLFINPAMLAAAEATDIMLSGHSSGISDIGFGRIYFRPFTVQEGSPLTRKTLNQIRLPGALVAALIREGEVIIPHGDDEIRQGDRLVVICKPEAIQYIQKAVGESSERISRMVIVGGGNVGSSIAKYFDNKRYKVKLFEDDNIRAWELANELMHVRIIDQDGTNLDVLEAEYLEAAEAFVSTTGSDEKNLMTAILASEHGVKRTVAVVHSSQYAELGKKMPITATLSPRILAANRVLGFVRRDNVHRVSLIAEGQAEIVEFVATSTLALLNKPLQELGMPKGIIVAALVRGTRTIIPRGDDEIREGDSVVMFCTHERIGYLEALLKRNKQGEVRKQY